MTGRDKHHVTTTSPYIGNLSREKDKVSYDPSIQDPESPC